MLGLDISSTAVKLLELSRTGDRYHVESYAVEPLPPDVVTEKNIRDVAGAGEVLRKVVSRAGAVARGAAIAVAGSAVITRIIEVDGSLSGREMELQISAEADQHIPYPLEDVSLDFVVRGASADDHNRLEVLLVACRQENVASRQAALAAGGLTARVVDIEAYAMQRALGLIDAQLGGGHRGLVVAIADIGATVTTLSIVADGEVVHTREQRFGGRQLTDEIQQRYGLSRAEAGRAKKHGGLPEDYAAAVLTPFRQAVLQQVSRALQLFYSSSSYDHVDRIVLGGGTASTAGVAEMVERGLATPTVVANPFQQMTVAPRVDAAALAADAPAMLIACGLAMRNCD